MLRARLVAVFVLALGNALLVIAHVTRRLGSVLSDPRSSMGEDRGFGELFGNAQLAEAIVAVGRVVIHHQTGLGVWLGVFGYLPIDDAFDVHGQGRGCGSAGCCCLASFGGLEPHVAER